MDRELWRDVGIALLIFLVLPVVWHFTWGQLAAGLVAVAIGLGIWSGWGPAWGLQGHPRYLGSGVALAGVGGVVLAIDNLLVPRASWLSWVCLTLYALGILLMMYSAWHHMLRSLFSRYDGGEQ